METRKRLWGSFFKYFHAANQPCAICVWYLNLSFRAFANCFITHLDTLLSLLALTTPLYTALQTASKNPNLACKYKNYNKKHNKGNNRYDYGVK